MSKRYTTETWVESAKVVHGDRYDYSKARYTNDKTKLVISCSLHGHFNQRPSSHLSGNGCPNCGGSRRKTKEMFVLNAKEVHGDKYSYSKARYTNNKTKLVIICKIHGDFLQSPLNHLNGNGCPFCAKVGKPTPEDWVRLARQVHGNRYSYTKFLYKSSREKSVITCKIHGDFLQSPSLHLGGCGCQKCAGVSPIKKEEWIVTAHSIHEGKYTYDKIDCIRASMQVVITCKIHGDFLQNPHNHLNRSGCPKCGGKNLENWEWVERFQKVHGNAYSYKKFSYFGAIAKSTITCKTHGDFQQRPSSHLRGSGCPICNSSHMERAARKLLTKLGVAYETQVIFKPLGSLRYDFWLPKKTILIEMDGEQHFKAGENGFWGGEEGFRKRQERDALKTQFAKDNGYHLIRVPYNAEPSPEVFLYNELIKHGVTKEDKQEVKDFNSPLPRNDVYQPSLF